MLYSSTHGNSARQRVKTPLGGKNVVEKFAAKARY